MSSLVDERGFNQGFELTTAQKVRLRRRADAIAFEMQLPSELTERVAVHVLELGCGTGELAYELAKITGAKVTGVDLSQKFVDYATRTHRHQNLDFRVADLGASSPESPGNKYDYIVGNGILHHLYHRLDTFLPSLARWLVPRGRLIFWEPNLWNPYIFLIFKLPSLRKMARLEPEEMAFSVPFIKEKLNAAGFSDVSAVTRDFLLPNTPTPLISAVSKLGNLLEEIPGLRAGAQSVFLTATAR